MEKHLLPNIASGLLEPNHDESDVSSKDIDENKLQSKIP
jgi:hypothetical protein